MNQVVYGIQNIALDGIDNIVGVEFLYLKYLLWLVKSIRNLIF